MTTLEYAARVDYTVCVIGSVLIVVGMLTWLKSRSGLVQHFFSLMGLCMLGVVGNYAARGEYHSLGYVLRTNSVYYLHVCMTLVTVLAIAAAGLEHLQRK